jgi:hypothetical protein
MKSRIILIPVALALLAGCMHARTDESRELPTAITSDESIVVLAKPQIEGAGAEAKFLDCVGDHLKDGATAISVKSNEAFTDALFPWFEPGRFRHGPKASLRCCHSLASANSWRLPACAMWYGSTATRARPMAAAASQRHRARRPDVGFGWWEKESSYEATVWDLKQSRSVGSIGTNVTGTSAIVGVVVPLPFIARVQGTACNRIAAQLHSFLAGTATGGT